MLFTPTKHEVIEEGFMVEWKQTEIMPGVTLKVYHGVEAVLYIGSNSIEFDWTDDAKAVFSDIDNCESIELLSILAEGITKFNKVEVVG